MTQHSFRFSILNAHDSCNLFVDDVTFICQRFFSFILRYQNFLAFFNTAAKEFEIYKHFWGNIQWMSSESTFLTVSHLYSENTMKQEPDTIYMFVPLIKLDTCGKSKCIF